MELERCVACDDFTGHAGSADDSLFCDCGDGPFCCDCWCDHVDDCKESDSGRDGHDGQAKER